MSVKAIDSSANTPQKRLGHKQGKIANNQSFTGFNPIVTTMDAISRGGFAASFIAQDGLGMVAPRIKEGMNRGRKEEVDPETGKKKKVGPYNWAFARREGVREILSGPSAFLIPAAILAVIKKAGGKANNVPTDLINTYGDNFAKIISNQRDNITNAGAKNTKARAALYHEVFKDALSASLDGKLDGDELSKAAQEMTDDLLKIENAKSKGFYKHFIGQKVEGSAEDLTQALMDKYMNLRKKYVSPSASEATVMFTKKDGKDAVGTSIGKLLSSLPEYADDAINSAQKFVQNENGDLVKFIKDFNLRRSGSRILSNLGMFLAVVGFYDIIPKLYNMGLKENPDEVKTEEEQKQEKAEDTADTKSKDVPFTGAAASVNRSVAKKVMNTGWLKKISDEFEFNGPSMSVTAMSTLLFAFCLPPRIRDAKDEHDRKEIIVRDIASFSAILFAANALSRGFSDICAKISGLALNTKPADHAKSFMQKIKNYFTPGNGVNVMKSDQLISKHSNLEQYRDGISGYIEFLKNNGGDPKKVFAMDSNVKEAAEKILGKSLKDADITDIEEAFSKARAAKSGTKEANALDVIYKAFKNPDNKFVRRAKTLNSAFQFASIVLLVPAFMIWLARYCERMTKAAKAKQKETQAEQNNLQAQPAAPSNPTLKPTQIPPAVNATKTSMAGFINKKAS